MIVLSYHQPHATLSAFGAKTVETRDQITKHRGWMAIHATKSIPPEVRERALVDPFRRVLDAYVPDYNGDPDMLPKGAIVGVQWLAAVYSVETTVERWNVQPILSLPGDKADYDDVPAYELAFGDYSPGRKAWWMTMQYPLIEPIPCRGMPGLWDTTILHQGNPKFSVDPTELEIRGQILAAHGVDISKHALDDAALWRLASRRATLGHPPKASEAASEPTETGVASSHDATHSDSGANGPGSA